jgi:hypothetical protein
VVPWDRGWEELAPHFTLLPGTRQIFDIAVESVQTSCGYGVPLMSLERERPTLLKHHARADPGVWAGKYRTGGPASTACRRGRPTATSPATPARFPIRPR